MKAKELRIGNWILANGVPVQVGYLIIESLVMQEKKASGHPNYKTKFEPIPLTHEILVKAGFWWSVHHQAFHFGDGAMNEFYDLNECYPSGYQLSTFKKKELIGQPFQYLHQLQNLYFELTGIELNIEI